MRMRRRLIAIMLLMNISSVAAQVPADTFKRGEILRIRSADNRVTGRYWGVSDSVLVINHDGTLRRFRLAAIDSIWAFHSEARKTARTGALVGGALGAGALGLFMRALCDTGSCASETLQAGAVGGVLGGAIGAVFGSLVGSAAGEWLLVMPSHR